MFYLPLYQQQDESARRHKENIDQIKEKAFEMTVLKHSTEDQKDAPKLAPYSTKKFCTVCNVLVSNKVLFVFYCASMKWYLYPDLTTIGIFTRSVDILDIRKLQYI